MKRYPAYKDSGIDTIGNIPAQWKCCKIKQSTHFLYGQSLPNEIRVEGKVPVYGSNGITGYHNEAITKAPCIIIGRKGSFGKVQYSPCKCYPIDTTFYIDKSATDNELHWLYYLLVHLKLDAFSKDSAVPGINREELNEHIIPLPDKTEQVFISNFLDHKTRLIDTLIEKKQKLVELLQEKRTALISHAVTKGLNPKAKMKDTGIEWLGKVPEHWDVKRLKHVLKRTKGALKTGPFGSQLKNEDFVETGVKVYNQKTVLNNDFESGEIFISPEKFELLKSFEVHPGDVLITSRGTIGKCAIVPDDCVTGVLHPCLIRFQADQTLVLNDFMKWFIQEAECFINNVLFESDATTIEVIYSDTLKNIYIPVPPLTEQKEILKYCSKSSQTIDKSINKLKTQLTALNEYRTTLISDVVTGKIDVRDEVIP